MIAAHRKTWRKPAQRRGRARVQAALVAGASAVLLCGCPGPSSGAGEWSVSLEADEEMGALMSVWGPQSDEVYAVGGQPGEDGIGVALRFDGDDWSQLELPSDTRMLNWVYGADDQVIVVGEAGQVLRSADEGQSFEPLSPAGVDEPLWGVWGTSAENFWVVGGDPFAKTAVLMHYANASWQAFDLPALDRTPGTLFKVWGLSADQVWAVGDAGIIIAWDGQAWTQQLAGTSSDLISLWGTGPDDIAAVGGRANGTLARFDGSGWQSEIMPGLPGMNGLWMDAQGESLIGGVFGTLATLPQQSAAFETQAFSVNPLVVHAVYGFDDGTRFAVGGSLDRLPPYVGVIARRAP